MGCIAIFVGLPASSAAEKLATFSASTAIILTLRPQSFDGQGNAGEQTGAADRNDHRLKIGNLLDDFEPIVPWPAMIAGSSYPSM